MGAPAIPSSVPKSRVHLVDTRILEDPDREPGMEQDVEMFYTDTGEAIPDDPAP
jgi:hypothetical protein